MEPWEMIMTIALIGIPFPIGALIMFVSFVRATTEQKDD